MRLVVVYKNFIGRFYQFHLSHGNDRLAPIYETPGEIGCYPHVIVPGHIRTVRCFDCGTNEIPNWSTYTLTQVKEWINAGIQQPSGTERPDPAHGEILSGNPDEDILSRGSGFRSIIQ